jgi:SAM-dependent methyltransferase
VDQTSEQVARQYSSYPYPDYKDLAGKEPGCTPSKYSGHIWPEGRPRRNLHILVAGCGTVQAAMLAYANRDCTVVGVDLSEASLAHERYLKDRHGLDNLALHKLDLRNVGELGQTFDLIVCVGVLHHMQDPDEGLRALAAVLEPRGAMFLMLYGAVRRYGIYLLQDVFRRLGIEQTADGIDFVRAALREVPRDHFAQPYLKGAAADLEIDAHIVDTFLHVRDRAYSVPEVLDFVERNGLVFQAWSDNGFYHPEGFLPPDSALFKAIIALPEREQWAISENLNILSGKHGFFACRPERDPKGYTFSFPGDDFLHYVPHIRPGCVRIEPPTPSTPGRYRRPDAYFTLPADEARLFESADGHRTIARCLNDALGHMAPARRTAFGRRFFGSVFRRGHMLFTKYPGGLGT